MLTADANSVAGAVAPLIDCPAFVSSQLAHIAPHALFETEQVAA